MKIFLSLCIALLFFSSAYAENTKSDDELIAEILRLDKLIEEEEKKQEKAIAKTRDTKTNTEAIMQLGKTVDKLAQTLGVDD